MSLLGDAVAAAGGEKMSDADYGKFKGRLDTLRTFRNHRAAISDAESEFRDQARIDQRARDPYGPGSPDSDVLDKLASQGSSSPITDRVRTGHDERQHRKTALILDEIAHGTERGQAYLRMYGERFRHDDESVNRQAVERHVRELRTGITTGGGATAAAASQAAGFVSPYIMDVWAAYRSPYRAVADQCDRSVALPDFGMQAYMPRITGGTTVATTTEGSATSEGDPTIVLTNGAVTPSSGQVLISQAMLDRASPGIEFDVVLYKQLADQLGAQIDLVAINAMLISAQSVTNSSGFALTTTSGVGGFLGDCHKAAGKLTDTAGVRLRPTHLFASSDFCSYIAAYADAQGRPVFSPCHDGSWQPLTASGDVDGQGFTGYVIPPGVALFADDNTPTAGTISALQLIVCRPSLVNLLEGPPLFATMPQYTANNLEPVVTVRNYSVCIPQYPTGAAVITGGPYAASNFA